MGSSLNFKQHYQTLCTILALNFLGCLGTETSWEDLESNYDHVLNVFGLMNLDSGHTSFIGLYRTTDLDELSQNFVGVDTVGYYEDDEKEEEGGYWVIDSIYEPAALIRDATVLVSDDQGNSYEFSFVEKITFIDTIYFDTTFTFYGYTFDWDTTIYDTNTFRINFYVDTTGTFNPQSETNYQLSITAPGFDPVSGFLTTPMIPTIDSLIQRGQAADTINASEPFDIFWGSQGNGKGMITGEVLFNNQETDTTWQEWCGGFFEQAVDFSDSSAFIPGSFCEETIDSHQPEDYFVRLTAMDDNYYEYFITGEIGEYANLLLNYPTTKGRSVGIEGGFGVFGSIGSSRVLKTILP